MAGQSQEPLGHALVPGAPLGTGEAVVTSWGVVKKVAIARKMEAMACCIVDLGVGVDSRNKFRMSLYKGVICARIS
jgi:hypothetical protein